MSKSYQERYREYAHLWCAQDWTAWQQLVSPTYSFDPGVGQCRDLASTLQWSRAIFAAFPDYRQRLEYVIETGNTVTGVAVAQGTLSGTLDVGGQLLKATGERFTLPYVKVVRFDEHGLVDDDRQYLDHALLMRMVTGEHPDGVDLPSGGVLVGDLAPTR